MIICDYVYNISKYVNKFCLHTLREKTLISYSLNSKKNALEITRKIYGYTDSSNYGKYAYERKGILSDIPIDKISRCAFFVDGKHANEIVTKLHNLGLQTKVYNVIIKKRI